MPKNLLFLSDKLPKPNYEKHNNNTHVSEDLNQKNYRSYNNINNNKSEMDINDGIHMKRPMKLAPIAKIIPEEKEKLNNVNSAKNVIASNSVEKILSNRNGSSINLVSRNISNVNGGSKIIIKKEPELYSVDLLAKQKNELRKLMLKNNNIHRRLNYLNINSQIKSSVKDLYKMFVPNINNRSVKKNK